MRCSAGERAEIVLQFPGRLRRKQKDTRSVCGHAEPHRHDIEGCLENISKIFIISNNHYRKSSLIHHFIFLIFERLKDASQNLFPTFSCLYITQKSAIQRMVHYLSHTPHFCNLAGDISVIKLTQRFHFISFHVFTSHSVQMYHPSVYVRVNWCNAMTI